MIPFVQACRFSVLSVIEELVIESVSVSDEVVVALELRAW
jgi:hypothetical protein